MRKNILIIATGGTIASMEDGRGLAPALTGAELVGYVPEINDVCDFEIVQPMNIDSTNMRPRDWLRIAAAIRERYDAFDGFVVLHGTDTMAYTAAALSYLIQDSPKPIVLTGSQRPMANPFTDAKLNLYQSLLYAADDASRDVSVVFGGQVIAGTRARKQRTMSDNAFISLNFPTIALIRGGRVVRASDDYSARNADFVADCCGAARKRRVLGGSAVRALARRCSDQGIYVPDAGKASSSAAGMSQSATKSASKRRRCSNRFGAVPRFYEAIDERVFVLKLTPEMDPSIFDVLADSYDAVIMETFGIGGIPEYDDASYKRAIFDWVDAGHTLVLTTQVPEEGLDLGVYEVGRDYADHPGILHGGDMSTEALVAKTMWALGQTDDPAELRRLFYRVVNYDRLPEE